MRTQLSSGEDVKIVFRHTISEPYRIFGVGAGHTRRRYEHEVPRALTECLVIGGTREQPTSIAHGVAACAWKDPFVKEAGRRIALARAVTGLSTLDQGRVLSAYYNRKRGGK